MVFGKTNQRETLISPQASKVLFECLLLVLLFSISMVSGLMISSNVGNGNEGGSTETVDPSPVEPEPTPEPQEIKPVRIDFQSIVDEWAASTSGNKSIIIYDPALDEIVGSYNPDEQFSTASLYKLFVVYEGYKRLNSGEWDSETPVGSTSYNLLECLDLSIRESYSPCAEGILAMIGRDELSEIIVNDYGLNNTAIKSLISTPSDILGIMKMFYDFDKTLSPGLLAKMKDSFLNQPATTYVWRQGLPSGFSVANVYDKVGWDYNPDGKYWNIYNEAAIVEFPEDNRSFIVVVMTNRVPFQKIRQFGTDFENAYLNANKY